MRHKQLPYYTLFLGTVERRGLLARVVGKVRRVFCADVCKTDKLREYLHARAREGWPVEASDPNHPLWVKVYHVSPQDLPPPPPGITAHLHDNLAESSGDLAIE